MVEESWTNDEKKRLRVMTIDPVRSPPSRLKSIISYFGTPGVSLWAVTQGDEPFHVSKEMGTKIRDFVAEGALDWVMNRPHLQIEPRFDAEWRGWLLAHPSEFSQAVDAYREKRNLQIQTAEIHEGIRASFMPPKVAYGALHQPFVDSIISRDPELAEVKNKFELALKNGAIASARKLSEKVGVELASRIAI